MFVMPDYSNIEAIDFVFVELREAARSSGMAGGRLSRPVVVEIGVIKGFSRLDMEAFITFMVMANLLVEVNGSAGLQPMGFQTPTPLETAKQNARVAHLHSRHSDTRV